MHDHARAIKTLLRFWYQEGYLPAPIVFNMPKMQKRRMPMLTAEQLKQILSADLTPRDLALIMFIADSGLRRAEISALNWGDVDIGSGRVRVSKGKGGKARTAVVGANSTVRSGHIGGRPRAQMPPPCFSGPDGEPV